MPPTTVFSGQSPIWTSTIVQALPLPVAVTPIQPWNLITEEPRPPMRSAFRVRDKISTRFGTRVIGGYSGRARTSVRVGERLDFFLVEYIDADMLIFTERDRHLDVMICLSTQDRRLTITAPRSRTMPSGASPCFRWRQPHRLIIRHDLGRVGPSLQDPAPEPASP